MSAYKELEKLVARIQQQLAPSSKVSHDVKLFGHDSNTNRQIDVLVEDRIGQYDIKIIIECKDYNQPVNVKKVEEFYGLFRDVKAHKGVMVSPKGFTEAAKKRAESFQLDLFSPVDTEPHKWQVTASVPAICDFRTAKISFGLSFSSPYPLSIGGEFFEANAFSAETNGVLGKINEYAIDKWNKGKFPFEVGDHGNVPIFDEPVTVDNGFNQRVPIDLFVGLSVRSQLYFGQLPIRRMSGFKDEIRGNVITNAFEVGILSVNEVETGWLKIKDQSEAPINPVLSVSGLVGWVAPSSQSIFQGF